MYPPDKLTPQDTKIILLSALGGSFEFYNFMIYIIFAPLISEIFLPQSDKLASLLAVYLISAIGYLARPLGGVLFSHYGDRQGRKQTFIYSISMMAVATFLIGVLPGYKQAGSLSSILLIIMVILQSVSVGGETPGAITFACEHVGKRKYGITCGVIIAFLNVGILCGMCINFLLNNYLTHDQLLAWGWRVPFIFGGMMGVFAIYLRRKMTESPVFIAFQREACQEKLPIVIVIKNHWRQIIQGIAITWLGAVVISLLFVYMPTYLTTIFSYSKAQISLLNTINLFFYSSLVILMGIVSDKWGRNPVLMMGAFGFVVFGHVLFSSFNDYSTSHLILTMMVMSVFGSCVATYPSTLVELFPASIRYSGVALTFNIGGIFGGLSPLITTYLIKVTGDVLAPSFYLIFSSLVCLLVIFTLKPIRELAYGYDGIRRVAEI